MAKKRGAHTYRPRVCQGPSPSTAGPSSSAVAGSPAANIAAAGPSSAASPSATVAGAGPRAPAVRPTTTPAVVAPAASDTEGSSSVTPAQMRYHTRFGPTPPVPLHPRPARRAPPAKRAWTSSLGSHHHRDLGPRPLHLIRVLPKPQTCPRGPSSGGLTSPTTPSRGMLATGIEIFMGSCTMISRPLPRTRGSEIPCSSYSDTIWSHLWCRVSTTILGSSPSSITR